MLAMRMELTVFRNFDDMIAESSGFDGFLYIGADRSSKRFWNGFA